MLRNGILTKLRVGILLVLMTSVPQSIEARRSRPLAPLTGLHPPAPAGIDYNQIVKDPTALLALGKALFWDASIGTDNQACASCHFHAGADPRTINQLSPGLNVQPTQDDTFGDAAKHQTGSGTAAGPNIALAPGDFPLHKLGNVNDRDSAVSYDSNDVVGSQGVFQGGPLTLLQQITRIGQLDACSTQTSTVFFINDAAGHPINTRKVEPRNTPTNINAVFNYRNFWDGRANNNFNGFNPFGRRAFADPTAKVWYTDGTNLHAVQLDLPNMSAASQAVGPATSSFEMACLGRTFADIGRRVLLRGALLGQAVAPNDSVFSVSSTPINTTGAGGLTVDYRTLVRRAFAPEWWQDPRLWIVDPTTGVISVASVSSRSGYQLDEINFAMFFGLAIDAYERTLISDQTPFDAGKLSANAFAGQALFKNKGRCINCHDGPLLSKATTFKEDSDFETVEHMPMLDPKPAFYDDGFYNIGVRPAFEDIGVGNTDPYGNPLSLARQFVVAPGTSNVGIDRFPVIPCGFEVFFNHLDCSLLPSAARAGSERVAVDGSFKVPSLRNVAMTPPYFHNGGQKSLADVVAFYNRGGDARSAGTGDTTGTGMNGRPLGSPSPVAPGMGSSNADPNVQPLGLSAVEQSQLVAFLQSLSDRRVACHSAPFDHPGLAVNNGQLPQDRAPADGNADDVTLNLRAVGAGGYANCAALFDQLNAGDLFVSSPAFLTLIK